MFYIINVKHEKRIIVNTRNYIQNKIGHPPWETPPPPPLIEVIPPEHATMFISFKFLDYLFSCKGRCFSL